MSSAEIARRSILFVAASALLIAALFYVSGGHSTVPDTLPTQISDKDFWSMIAEFSEAGGYFRSDNFLSNEGGYQHVIPILRNSIPHGVYIGVGPEQNFTYIVGFEPKMAFVVDIRRQNMIEHLLYKALIETARDRAEFLSGLFSRQRPASLSSDATADALVEGYEKVEASEDLYEENVHRIVEYLEETKGFDLSSDDEKSLRHVYRAFFDDGPDLRYTFLGGYGGYTGMPTYGELMTEDDGQARNWNFLANEEQFRILQRLHKKNLIVPLVGDFAGPKALRSVGEYLKQHNAVVSVFYTSNVEQYLFQDDENWKRFYGNVAKLPVDSSSTFIRYVLNNWRSARRARAFTSPIDDVVRAYDRGRIRSYYDVIDMSR